MSTAAVRPTVRVLLLAGSREQPRVLLFRAVDGYWFPPGGAVEPGETYEQAARRELAEETGRPDVALGPHIWNRRQVFEWRGRLLDLRERWYLGAAPEAFALDVAGWTAEEQADITEYRWWSVDDLAATEEPLVPTALAELVERLVREGAPTAPMEVGL